MKNRYIVLFITNLALIIMSIGILLTPLFKFNDLKIILLFSFGLYTLMKFTNFYLLRKKSDFESLLISITSLIATIFTYFLKLTSKEVILLILIWMGVNALIKLKKADFYHDRQNKIWLLKLLLLFIFIISGLLTSINLFDEATRIVAVGYFFLISSILDIIEVTVNFIGEVNASNK